MEQNKINLTIDNRPISVNKGTTLLDAAKTHGIEIPTLCHINLEGTCVDNHPTSCRMCVVEVAGRRNLAPACATICTEGMEVHTNSIRVLKARRTVLELILSNHPSDCLICPKSGDCDLQELAQKLKIHETPFAGGERSKYEIENSVSIVRDMNKCILCRRCETMCNDVQTVGAIGAINRGFGTTIAPAFGLKLSDSECTYCGQCVAVCPVGALTERDNSGRLIDDLFDPNKIVIVQTAPAVRVAIGEEFGYPAGTIVTGKLVTALKQLGFDYVFDTDFAADLTIMEEGSELLDRLTRFLDGDKTVPLPILTSCCPAWVNFFEHQFPDMLDIPSTARSPQQMFGAIAKNYWAEKMGIPREKLVVVSIMPCLAKKYECGRDEFKVNGNPDVDYSLSTRELAAFIKQANINFEALEDSEFDAPLGASTGAAVIFGTTGGVMEAALRTAYEFYTGKTLEKVDFHAIRGFDGIRHATIDLNGFELKVGIAHGLGNARLMLEDIRDGKSEYHAIEIMACPGGCIGGGGQPLHHGNVEILNARQRAVYEGDKSMPLRKSHENPYIQKLYEEYLGKPLGEKSHMLLHTHYFSKSK
ncbi:MAG: 4Fe-4S binding protein [Bacteroidales bacterium]|jgi:NADH-quinone oxidoreductase subunit G/NADP-reducing hydrogenase subunit HndD|nr:NADH-dependent [FeFe] hydrogenase, group A6 [Bacteroidota bacterium]NLN99872.1 4Fe-4S binding protein [Bacteroidales bacterium]